MVTPLAAQFLPVFLGLLASLLLSPAYAGYRRDLCRARNRICRGSRIVETPRGAIEYAMAGDGPPVLVVHGGEGGFDQGLAFAEPLIRSGFRVIVMSRFGYLRTPLPEDASPAAQADAHACLLDALGIERVAVATASAGAPSSLQFALRHPQRVSALVLLVPVAYAPRSDGMPQVSISPLGRFLTGTLLRSDFLFWVASRLARKSVTREFLGTSTAIIENATADEKTRVRKVFEGIQPVSSRWLGLINDAAVNVSLSRYELENISAPTLIIAAHDDRFGTFEGARYTAAHIAGARFIALPNGGHLWVGHQENVVSEVAAFLKKVQGKTLEVTQG